MPATPMLSSSHNKVCVGPLPTMVKTSSPRGVLHREPSFSLHSESSDAESLGNNSSMSSSFATLNSRLTKTVRFQCDNRGRPQKQFHTTDVILTEELIDSMWWTPEDFKSFRRQCKREARGASKTLYPAELDRIYQVCGASGGEIVRPSTRDCLRIAATSVRGLEVLILSKIVDNRLDTIQGVIECQTSFGPRVSEEDRARQIANVARRFSKAARQLASVMALGDAIVARKFVKDETTSSAVAV